MNTPPFPAYPSVNINDNKNSVNDPSELPQHQTQDILSALKKSQYQALSPVFQLASNMNNRHNNKNNNDLHEFPQQTRHLKRFNEGPVSHSLSQ